MKPFLIAIFILFFFISNFIVAAVPILPRDETLILNRDYLMSKPLFKKGIFFFFKGRNCKACDIDLHVRFSVQQEQDKVYLALDDINHNTTPIQKNVSIVNYDAKFLQDFLNNAIETFNHKPNTKCITNFTFYYSLAIIAQKPYNMEFFTFHPTRRQTRTLLGNFQTSQIITTHAIQGRTTYATFPQNAQSNSTMVITDPSALHIPDGGTLYLPDNFTLKFAPELQGAISWHFDKVIFGNHATIDLSQRDLVYTSLPTPLPNNTPIFATSCTSGSTLALECSNGDCNYGSNGHKGVDGNNGLSGFSGKNMRLVTNFISNTGDLWIRTDGSNGQTGQDAGQGGYGAHGACGVVGVFGIGNIQGGNGGIGGIGGSAGNGGDEALAGVDYRDATTDTSIAAYGNQPHTNLNDYSPSARPIIPIGMIVISGTPGAAGKPGRGGNGGERGHGCNCGFLRPDAHDGQDGTNGNDGKLGTNGKFITQP